MKPAAVDAAAEICLPRWSGAPSLDLRAKQEPLGAIERGDADDLRLTLSLPTNANPVRLQLPVIEGEPVIEFGPDGYPLRMIAWGLERLGSTVWAVTPSVHRQIGDRGAKLNAFIILCDVPDPPPWRAAVPS